MELYIAEMRLGKPTIVKATVRETPKKYIVQDYKPILNHSWGFYARRHLRKEETNAFVTEAEALAFLVAQLVEWQRRQEKGLQEIIEQQTMLKELLAEKLEDAKQ